MSVNLKKNEKALLAAYNDVLSDKSETNWVVFGYEGNSNDLKVVETGDGGLEEMVDELSGGKVMYAYLRVIDPNTQLPKNVLINWSGEGVPPNRMWVCVRHTTDVARFFRGAHVTINARSEMDLDEDTVLEKVSKASGANFSFHKEKAHPMSEAGSVGSVYKKTNPRTDINPEARDKFWDQQVKLEEQCRAAEKREAAEQRKREEQECRDRDAQEAAACDRVSQERAKRIDEQKMRECKQQKRETGEREAALQSRLRQRESEMDSQFERENQEKQRCRVQEHSAVSSAVRQKIAGFEEKAQETSAPAPMRPPKKTPKALQPASCEPTPELETEPEQGQQEQQYLKESEQELYVQDVQQQPPPPQDSGDYAQEILTSQCTTVSREQRNPSNSSGDAESAADSLYAKTISDYEADSTWPLSEEAEPSLHSSQRSMPLSVREMLVHEKESPASDDMTQPHQAFMEHNDQNFVYESIDQKMKGSVNMSEPESDVSTKLPMPCTDRTLQEDSLPTPCIDRTLQDDSHDNHFSLPYCIKTEVGEIHDQPKVSLSQEILIPLNREYLTPGQNGLYIEDDDYSALCTLGEGAFGCIVLCKDHSTNKKFAIKENTRVSDHCFESIRKECVLLGKLRHNKHIITILGAVIESPLLCKMMIEATEDGDLSQMLTNENGSGNALSVDQSLFYIQQILKGVDFLHQKTILHLDIKSQNVLVFDYGRSLKITDFGSAVLVTEIHAGLKGSSNCTPFFSAPEVLQGLLPNFTSDIWSAICILIQMLTGNLPGCYLHSWDNEIMAEFIHGYTDDKIEDLVPFNLLQDCPEVAQLFRDVLKIEKNKRPSAQELLSRPIISSAWKYEKNFMNMMPLPLLPSLHPLFQEVPIEAAVLPAVIPDELCLACIGGPLSSREEHTFLPDVIKPFLYLFGSV